MNKSRLLIFSRGQFVEAAVAEPIVWELSRKGVPGKLTFDVLNDDDLSFFEGDAVRFDYEDTKIFFGYVFTKKRTDNRRISVTAYDQLRYLKNKDTYTYKGLTADRLLRNIANDFRLKVGTLANTGHVIPTRVEDNQELFTIMENALAITTNNTGRLYTLYDDYGSLTLREVSSMRLDLLIDEETAESFDYTSSIDEGVYNQVKIFREDKKSKKREIYIAKDTGTQNQWGILQLTDSAQNGENPKTKADALLRLHNQKTRRLSINGVFGDNRVRPGSLVAVRLNLGDLRISKYMLVDKAKHTFKESQHSMDLIVLGGEFIA